MSRYTLDRIQCFDCGLIRAFPDHIEWDLERKVYRCCDRLECAAQPERPSETFAEIFETYREITKDLEPTITSRIPKPPTPPKRRRSNRR